MKNNLNKFTKNCSIGLPGGPNEIKVSMNGYKNDSPDRFNNMNVIPSGNITMKDVNHPVYGIDEYGNKQMMMPDGEYTFPGNYVTEIPLKQDGGPVKDLYAEAATLIEEGNDPNEVMQFLVEGLMPHMEEQEAVQTAEEMMGYIMGQGEQQMPQEQQMDPNMQFAQTGRQISTQYTPTDETDPYWEAAQNQSWIANEELSNPKYYGEGKALLKNKYGDKNYWTEYDASRQIEERKQRIEQGKDQPYVWIDQDDNMTNVSQTNLPHHGGRNNFQGMKKVWELNKANRKGELGYQKLKWNSLNNPDAIPSFQSGGAFDDFVDMELTDAEIESYRQQGYTIEEL